MSSWRCFFSRRVEAVILERKSPVVILTMSSSTVPHLRIPPALPRHAGKWDPLGDGWILHPATRPSIPFSMQAVAVRCIKGWIAGCNRGFAGRQTVFPGGILQLESPAADQLPAAHRGGPQGGG